MTEEDDLRHLRARDFWTSIALFVIALFLLWKTTAIPLTGGTRGGVNGVEWYNSAAIVPLGLFCALLLLSLVLMVTAIRAGGAKDAFEAVGMGWNTKEVLRVSCLFAIMLAYIAALVPRVDFIICSALVISSLIFGFYKAQPRRMVTALAFVGLPAVYAMAFHLPRNQWRAHNDDWFALLCWIALSALILLRAKGDRVLRITPALAVLAPSILVCAMAFGFRQNVPARDGLIFSQIEYHYHVTLRPLWRR